MDNPFSGVTRTRSERKTIPAGIYGGTLREVKPIQVTDKKTQEKVTKIIFSFYIATHDAEVSQFFRPSLSDNSHIVKFLKAVCGDALTPEIQGSSEKLWILVQSLVGKDYNLVITLTNGFNNVQTALPLAPQSPPLQPPTEDVSFTFSDDIPF